MALENYTGWIKDMVATNPTGADPKSQGDDHMRGMKFTSQTQFSGLTLGKAITVNEDEINAVVDKLPLAGGLMEGNIDMDGLDIEEVQFVDYAELITDLGSVSGVINIFAGQGNVQIMTLTGASTITFAPTQQLATNCVSFTLHVTNGAAGVTWTPTVNWGAAGDPELSAGRDILTFTRINSLWDGFVVRLNADA